MKNCFRTKYVYVVGPVVLSSYLKLLVYQGYEVKRLRNSFKKFYGRYPDLLGKYQSSVKDMIADSFPD